MHLLCKIFPDMGRGGLIGENTERFLEKADAAKKRWDSTAKRFAGQQESSGPDRSQIALDKFGEPLYFYP